jgi:hypothetical protein
LVSRSSESNNFAVLENYGIGPKSLHETDTYRIEEFIPSRNMRREELGKYAV